jgi:hypothetical protein
VRDDGLTKRGDDGLTKRGYHGLTKRCADGPIKPGSMPDGVRTLICEGPG